jgi:hypothetical protein
VKLVRLRRPKFHVLSDVDYKKKTNAVVLLDLGYTLREEHAWD